jgi:translation initiation factor IF-3
VRLIDENGKQAGILSLKEALEIAKEKRLDLVEIAPNSSPPVCKIMDYGKFIYETEKKLRESKKRQVGNELKTLKLRLSIGEWDLNIKKQQIKKFLEGGNKVKLIIMFRGREILYSNKGFELLNNIFDCIKDIGRYEKRPKLENKNLIAIISPISKSELKGR